MSEEDKLVERIQGEKSKAKKEELEARIGRTESGNRFLGRVYEIGRPKPPFLELPKESNDEP